MRSADGVACRAAAICSILSKHRSLSLMHDKRGQSLPGQLSIE
jgi:hypothetical protein